jgi:hypothetical protein
LKSDHTRENFASDKRLFRRTKMVKSELKHYRELNK